MLFKVILLYFSDYKHLDLPNLKSIVLGDATFLESLRTIMEGKLTRSYDIIIIDLPSLITINLGSYSLNGRDNDEHCVLLMRGE